jgi:hypothetical protein
VSSPPGGERPSLDQTLKRLLTRAHDGFLALVAPGYTWRAERSVELPAGVRLADLAWEVAFPDGARGILHIELQTRVEADIGERLAEYVIRLFRRDHMDIRSVVVYLREARSTPASPFVIPWGTGRTLMCDFDEVRLWELPQERVLGTPDYALWPLAGLMAGATVESTEAAARRLVEAPLPEEERRELAGQLVALAGTRLPVAALLAALRRNPMLDDLLTDNPLIQALVEQGREQGREQGALEAQREMARAMLQARFGPLGDDVLAALASADRETLLALATNAATDTPEQVRARLGLA